MPQIEVRFNIDAVNKSLDRVALDLVNEQRDLLEEIGLTILGFAQQAYVDKGRGGTGSDGIKWAPLKVSTILARLRNTAGHIKRRKVTDIKLPRGFPLRKGQKNVLVVAVSKKENQALFTQLAKAGIKFHDAKTGMAIKGNKARFKAGTLLSGTGKASSRTVALSPGSYEIGTNTGMQKNTLQPALKRGDTGDNLVIKDAQVTVGAVMNYSEAFNKLRPIMPDDLPAEWREAVEAKVVSHSEVTLINAIKKEGLA